MFGLENNSAKNQILSGTQPRELEMCVVGVEGGSKDEHGI